MSGIVGIINYTEDISNNYPIIRNMTKTLSKRGPDKEGLFFSKHANFGHTRLCITDLENNKQPMSCIINEITYTIVFDGRLYNSKELENTLKDNGFKFKDYSDTEILLKAYIHYGKDVCKYLNGIFAFGIWNSKTEELFISRDHFGIKPLYYSVINNNFIFASEIKSILEHPKSKSVINKTGISELFGVGPCHSPGLSPFKSIEELEPAHFVIYKKDTFIKKQYWKLETKPHTDSLEKTCENIRYLLQDSIERQLSSNTPICLMLSGGLDSSIITAYASKYYENICTFSVDYVDNDKHFIKNDFQPNTDNYYIDLMIKEFNTNHKRIILDTPELFKELESATIARDFPGMADVDSSYLLFFKQIKKEFNIALSGECSDEIFGGYPWYFKKELSESNTFPWSLAIEERQQILNKDISKEINLKEYVDTKYNQSLDKIEYLNEDTEEDKLYRKLIYLTSNWFMQTLLDRTDRMAMYNGFEVRVPFCDYRIVEYLWNIPWKMKAYEGREKGLLRYAVKDLLPKEIIYRKKSPYPKTHNPNYLKIVKNQLTKIMEESDSPINKLLNKDYIMEIINTDGSAFKRPWFGQLMTGPQLMAYLIQVNLWLERYNPEIVI